MGSGRKSQARLLVGKGFIEVTNWQPTQWSWLIQVKLLRVVTIALLDWTFIFFRSIGDTVIEVHNLDLQNRAIYQADDIIEVRFWPLKPHEIVLLELPGESSIRLDVDDCQQKFCWMFTPASISILFLINSSAPGNAMIPWNRATVQLGFYFAAEQTHWYYRREQELSCNRRNSSRQWWYHMATSHGTII